MLWLAVACAAEPAPCKWSWKPLGCLPKDACKVKPRFGVWCVSRNVTAAPEASCETAEAAADAPASTGTEAADATAEPAATATDESASEDPPPSSDATEETAAADEAA